jgi:hypothetical protein
MFFLTVIAGTGDRFADFAPYVASVNEAGVVAFQAALTDGSMGVFVGSGDADPEPARPIPLAGVSSHPDLNDAGDTAFYGVHADGRTGFFLLRAKALHTIAQSDGEFAAIGPLGPTISEAGQVAFRANLAAVISEIYTGHTTAVTMVADTRARWSRFHGLPVIRNDGTVVFRADGKDGVGGIYAARGLSIHPVVETGPLFKTLAHFPSAASDGTVVFAATLQTGGEGVFSAKGGIVAQVVGPDDAFESCRGALVADSGVIIAIATPRGRRLGLFAGPDPDVDRILALGDPLLGSEISDLAANPVSLNSHGRLAVRVLLADGRQLILRADPIGDRADRWVVGGEGLEPPTPSV